MNSRPSSAMAQRYSLRRLTHKALSSALWCYLPSVEMIQCQWCHAQNQPGTTSCQTCGAPLDEKDKVSDSGWRERSEEHTSELQSQSNLVCRLLLEKKKKQP